MNLNLPNTLTLLRIVVLLPLAVLFYFLPLAYAHQLTVFCILLMIVTDYLDGFLARRWKQGTRFGAFLDPVADKLVVVTGCIVISAHYSNILITLCSIVIVAREIIISALREWMAELGKRVSIKVLFIGKLKVNFQAFAIVILIWYGPASSRWVYYLGVMLLLLAVTLTLWSMVVYLRHAWPDFTASSINESMPPDP